jgi:small subunit ribosomal protein S2
MPENELTQPLGTSVAMYPGEASREMIDAGVFYGRKKTKTNPKMRPFVFANRAGIEIINLQKTADALEEASRFVKEMVSNGKELGLVVGTEPAAESAVRSLADRFTFPYVTARWVGGTITNFPIIAKRIDHLKKTRAGLASGAFEAYTKKERLEMDREVKRLETLMGGLENLSREPDFIIIVNPVVNVTAVREARRRKIPIIALANVDADPDVIDYLVPGNDKAKSSVAWFMGKMEKAIAEGMAMKAAPKAEEMKDVAEASSIT